MTDDKTLRELAEAAIRQRPHDRHWWREVAIAIPTRAEQEFMAAADPATILRLLRRKSR